MRLLLYRVLLKLQYWARQTAVRHTEALAGSYGFDAVARLVMRVNGSDAVRVLRTHGALVGNRTRIMEGVTIHNAEQSFEHLRVGSDCHLGRQVFLDLAGPIVIGDRVTISMRCLLLTHINVGDSRCGVPSKIAGIAIGDDAYLGAGAIVLPGVSIGVGAVIAAGAVVNRSVAAWTVVAGVPARSIASGVRVHDRPDAGTKESTEIRNQ